MQILRSIFVILVSLLIQINGHGIVKQSKFNKNLRGLENINGSYYYFSPNGLKYSTGDAAIFCNDIGMKLISLQTKEKEEMINNYKNNNGYDDRVFWTSGIRYQGSKWLWSGIGEIFTYTNWFQGQPDDSSTSTDVCVIVTSLDKWEDNNCSNSFGIICEQ